MDNSFTGQSTGDSDAPIAHTKEEIIKQLEILLLNPEFRFNSRRCAFLRYIVEETLEGRSERLKGASIAQTVFNRNEDFDPQSDPVVRIEARRLRRDLDSFYMNAGKAEVMRISIPKGRYVPTFSWKDDTRNPKKLETPVIEKVSEAEQTASTPQVSKIDKIAWFKSIAILGSLAALALLYLGVSEWSESDRRQASSGAVSEHGQKIVVLPFDTLNSNNDDQHIAEGITQELITSLTRFPDMRVFSVPASFQFDPHADPVSLGNELGVNFVVSGGLRSTGDKLRVGGRVTDASTGEIIWSGTYDRDLSPSSILDTERKLAEDIATELGEPFSSIKETLYSRVSNQDVDSLQSYECVLHAYAYRRTFEDELFETSRKCLQDAVVRDPHYAESWAMLGWLQYLAAREDMVPDAEKSAEIEKAQQAASRAIELDTNNQHAFELLAAIAFENGDYEKAESLQREVLARNPNDPEAIAQLGWRLAVRGDWDRGVPLLEKAIDRSANPPGWYFHLISAHEYIEGNYEKALTAAERSAIHGSAVGLSLAAISHAKLGNMTAAEENLDAMANAWGLMASDPAAAYRNFQTEEKIIDVLVEGLHEAGWKPRPDGFSQ